MEKTVQLTPRLQAVADAVPPCNTAADIGTDHAYIPVYLVQNDVVKSVIASDVVKGPVKRAEENVAAFGLSDKITIHKANGLQGLPQTDVIIIAGMGGKLICDILAQSPDKAKSAGTLVLQPMTAVYEVRRFLQQNGYRIVSETLAKEDDKIYNILVVKQGEQTVDREIYFHIGEDLIKQNHPLLGEYIAKKLHSFDIATTNMANSTDRATVEKREALLELKRMFAKVGENLDKNL